MKTLLISYYWYPYNNSGTFRWANFSKFIDFNILTCRRPLRSFIDYSIQVPYDKRYKDVRKFGAYLPPWVWGLIAPLLILFSRYDLYIITSPPETMLFGAWFLQLLGKNVIVDMRDAIEREKQPIKKLTRFYKYFYKRINNVIVAFQFFDPTKKVIYSGYEDIIGATAFKGYYSKRLRSRNYLYKLTQGFIPDQSKKPVNYSSGSAQTFRYLGFPINKNLHPEVYNHKLCSVKDSAKKYSNYLYPRKNDNF